MSITISLWPYKIFNSLYWRCFGVYKFLYFNYKWLKDNQEIKFITKVVKPGMTVVDVGANIGFYTLLLADLVGETGQVHAFEPETTNFNHLRQVCKNYRNVKINRMAVGSKTGEIDLFVSQDLNVDHLAYDDGGNRHRVRIPCVTLDRYLGNKTRVDFVKIDTQGYEHQVLLGGQRIVRNSPRITILAEFSAFDLSLAGTSPQEHIKLIKRLGLKTGVLGKKFLIKNPNRAVYYNLLYVKEGQSINF